MLMHLHGRIVFDTVVIINSRNPIYYNPFLMTHFNRKMKISVESQLIITLCVLAIMCARRKRDDVG